MQLPNYPLYAILNIDDVAQPVEELKAYLGGGIKIVQLRSKSPEKKNLVEIACEARSLCTQNNAKLIINDFIDVALFSRADGVHLGQGDQAPELAREILGENAIIGLSTHTLQQVSAAQHEPVDYLGFGPIYNSKTKSGHAEVTGLNALREVCSASKLPIVAIGGIDEQNAKDVFKNGATAVAVINALGETKSLAITTKQFIEAKSSAG